MKCAFGCGSCNSEATYVATRKAGWQHSMNFANLKMTKAWRKAKKSPCCDFHKKRFEETYPDDYKFRAIEGEIVSGPDGSGGS